MLNRFKNGTIIDCITGEDIKNNDIYILDPETRTIRKPQEPDEWLICQLVYVYDSNYGIIEPYNNIKNGSICRCWIGYLVL